MVCPELAWSLTTRFGVPFEATVKQSVEGTVFEIRPAGVSGLDGFAVLTTVGWQSVQSRVQFGSFAAGLMASTAKAEEARRSEFQSFSRLARDAGAEIKLLLDDAPVDDTSPDLWPDSSHKLALSLVRAPVDTADGSPSQALALADRWSLMMVGMIVSLLPLEATGTGRDPATLGLPEGAVTRAVVNRYERSPVNRALCLEANGTVCRVCGFDFGKTYGLLGRGFIEVHHVLPVSRMAHDYVVDPVVDLVPLCSNCHSMAHRREEPFTVEELMKMLECGVGGASTEEVGHDGQ